DARLSQGNTYLTADELDIHRARRTANAFGKVHLTDPLVDINASQGQIDVDDETGELDNAALNLRHGEYYLAGRQLSKLLGQHYTVEDGYFTTCSCEEGTPSWSISGRHLDVHLGGTGEVRDVKFNVLGYPVIKIPF